MTAQASFPPASSPNPPTVKNGAFRWTTFLTATIWRPIAGALLKAGFSYQVHGYENLAFLDEPVILAGNHTGFLDTPMVLCAAKRPLWFITGADVLKWPLIGVWVSIRGVLPINGAMARQTLKKAVRELVSGHSVCIFPEGQLTRTGELGEFKGGVDHLQQHSGAPIVPFAIQGGFEAWCWGMWFPKFVPISITFGDAIMPDETLSKSERLKLLESRVAQLMAVSH